MREPKNKKLFCKAVNQQKLKEMVKFNKAINANQIEKASRLLESVGALQEAEESICFPPELRRTRR